MRTIFIGVTIFIVLFNNCSTIRKWIKERQNCTMKLTVEIIEIKELRRKGGIVPLYKPVFETYLSGEKQLINSAIYSWLFKFKKGQKLQIYVNPNKLQEFRYDSPYKERLFIIDFFSCFMQLVFLAIVILYV